MINNIKQIAPSIFAADFANLEKGIRKAEKKGVEYLHIDIMDGNFVPNISFGPKVVKDIRKKTDLIFDTHLMIKHPLKYIDKFLDSGSDLITFHIESEDNTEEIIKTLKQKKSKIGISIKPNTKFEEVIPYLDQIDLLLIMTVEPGFSGQTMIEKCLDKIKQAKEYKDNNKLSYIIQADGGIKEHNYQRLLDLGSDLLVMGSAFYK